MKLTLAITGSASALAQILATLPDDASVDVGEPVAAPAAPPAYAPPAPAPIPGVPGPIPTNLGGNDGDENEGTPNAAPPALDSAGLPWDERIHATTKAIKDDGTWTKRRGGPKGADLAAIEGELRASVAAGAPPMPAPVVPPVAAPIPVMPPPVAPPAPMPVPVAAPIPVMPPPAPVYVPPVAPAPIPVAAAPVPDALQAAANASTGAVLDFGQFMQHLSGQMTKVDGAGVPLVHTDYLAAITAEIATAFGTPMAAITDIQSDPVKIGYAVQLLQRDGRW